MQAPPREPDLPRARVHADARLATLADIGRRLATAPSHEALIDLVADAALEVLDADSASISVMEPDHGLLRVLRNAGDLASWEQRRPTDEVYRLADFPQLSVTFEDAQPWVANRDAPESPTYLALLDALGMDSSLSLPVLVGTTVWGEIGACRRPGRPRFGPDDLAAGMAFSGLVAAALGGARQREELERLAYHDGLTGLANRRAVDDLLQARFEAPLRETLAVLIADVDGLKSVNDRHGHHLGDRLLRDVAVLLSRQAGLVPGSLAARLGGDEFCLVLPGLDEHAVDAIASRLTDGAAELGLGEGLSCGWALTSEWPGDAETPAAAARALLRLADAAQYRAKRDGRTTTHQAVDRSGPDPAELNLQVADAVLASMRSVDGAADRLAFVGSEVGAAVDAASWAVSISERGGPARILINEETDRLARADHQPTPPGTAYELDRYPATAAALLGGSLHATLDEGDPSERAYLAAHGYDELVGAGTPEGDRAWLLEVVGDAATAPLAPLEGLLRVLVEHAVHGRSLRRGVATGGRAPTG